MYAQVTQLFSSAPDLLEDFKQFLPESAAQAKAQAAAKQASEDAAMLSNVRGDSGYGTGLQQAQVQTPRPDIKMRRSATSHLHQRLKKTKSDAEGQDRR